ncbi:membrane protein [Lentibacillus halophilus]|uniref:Membrane protein n=1 Tax=Lentibacillus halophilus TaxID=295065 RepID=A0ABN0Z702_9BACI
MELLWAHWLYLAGTLLIILTLLCRQNVVVPALIMSFFVSWSFSGSFLGGIQAIFNSNLTAASELFNIFLIIAIMTALLRSIQSIGADEKMIQPLQKIMKNGTTAYWVLAVVTYFLSLFFWPAPAVPLIGALLIPVAIKAGLSPIGAAISISLAGHGMALSSDFILKVAPELTASGSGALETSAIGEQTFILSLIAGAISLSIAYVMVRTSMKKPAQQNLTEWENSGDDDLNVRVDNSHVNKGKYSSVFAFVVPFIFLIIVAYVITATFSTVIPSIDDGAGSSLVGGTAILLIIVMSLFRNYKQTLQDVSDHIVSGFVFAFKVMGLVIPVAAFFFIGSGDLAGQIFGTEPDATPSFLFDLVQEGRAYIPDNAFFTALGVLVLGMVSGLDGSGFSALPLIGSLSDALAASTGMDPTTLASIGQIGAIWMGGGTLVAWSPIIAIAGFAKISVIDLVRKSVIPVVIGLFMTMIAALLFW